MSYSSEHPVSLRGSRMVHQQQRRDLGYLARGRRSRCTGVRDGGRGGNTGIAE